MLVQARARHDLRLTHPSERFWSFFCFGTTTTITRRSSEIAGTPPTDGPPCPVLEVIIEKILLFSCDIMILLHSLPTTPPPPILLLAHTLTPFPPIKDNLAPARCASASFWNTAERDKNDDANLKEAGLPSLELRTFGSQSEKRNPNKEASPRVKLVAGSRLVFDTRLLARSPWIGGVAPATPGSSVAQHSELSRLRGLRTYSLPFPTSSHPTYHTTS